jgi:hypothetical protein
MYTSTAGDDEAVAERIDIERAPESDVLAARQHMDTFNMDSSTRTTTATTLGNTYLDLNVHTQHTQNICVEWLNYISSSRSFRTVAWS